MQRITAAICVFLFMTAGTVTAQTKFPLGHPGNFLKQADEQNLPVRKPSGAAQDEYGEQVTFSDGYVYHCDWSPDGQWIAYEENGEIFVIPANGGDPVNLCEDVVGYSYLPSFTPDNSGVTFTVYDSNTELYYIMFSDFTGSMKQVMIENAIGAVWSPDGRYVIYRDYETSQLRIYDYQDQRTWILAPGDYDDTTGYGYGSACFTPDGAFVIASLVADGGQRLFRIPIDGSGMEQLTWHDGVHNYPDVSPDGRWILYTDSGTEIYTLFVYDNEAGESYPLFPDSDAVNFMGRFSATPDRFCYIHDDNGLNNVYIADFIPPVSVYVDLIYPNGGEKLPVDQSYYIAWNSTGIELVRLDYSTDGGSTWKLIEQNIPASVEGYSWQVPVVETTSALIRIRGTTPEGDVIEDESDEYFAIVKPYLRVVAPNGGEVWNIGATYNITWEARNVEYVVIEYSTNAGNTWNAVASGVEAAKHSFAWTIPDTPSTTCKVRISDSEDMRNSSVTYGSFTIQQGVAEPYLRVVSPNGGGEWTIGSEQKITWDARNVSTVKIELSRDNGTTWQKIATNVTASTKVFTWLVTAPAAKSCRIRITDESNPDVYSISYASFMITTLPFIRVTSPNGGESLQAGTTYTITWDFHNIDKFHILYSTVAGTWNVIAENVDINITATTGTYQWTVPSEASETCRIRVVDASGSGIGDMSDANFSITAEARPFIKVLSPAAGDTFKPGDTATITWQAQGVSMFHINYSADEGETWNFVDVYIPSTYTAGSNVQTWSYKWVVPDNPSSVCIVKVHNPDDEAVHGLSEVFTIAAPGGIQVLYPNGGETFVSGSIYTIEWEAQEVQQFDIVYSPDGGSTWNTIVEGYSADISITSDQNLSVEQLLSFDWYVPDTPSSICILRVLNSQNPDVFDDSDGYFIIESSQTEGSVTLTYPVGGESFVAGSVVTITWTYQGLDAVDIEITTDGGDTWDPIVYDYPASAGQYEVIVPDGIDSDECYIWIGDADYGPADDMSYAFTITPKTAESAVLVHAPIGGDELIGGREYLVKWEAINVDYVDIYFTIDGGEEHIAEIAKNVNASLNRYSWMVPANNDLVSSNCYIIFFEAGTTNAIGANLSPFSITMAEGDPIEINYPVAGAEIDAGSQAEIDWYAVSTIQFVAIHYSTDNGSTWNLIASRVDASTGTLMWTVPKDVVSDNCLVRIRNADNVSVFAVSESFKVLPDPTNTNAVVVLDTDFKQIGIQDRPVYDIAPNALVGFAAYSANWRTASAYRILMRWDSAMGTYNKALTLLSMNGQTITVNGDTATLPVEDNILSADSGTTDFTILRDEAGAFEAKVTRTSLGVSRLSKALLYVGVFQTSENFGAGDSLRVRIDVTVTDKLGNEKLLDPRMFRVYGISEEKSIAVTAPNGGEEWSIGSEQDITWDAEGVGEVRIEYSVNGGGDWVPIADAYDASLGYYTWMIPDMDESTDCLVRVTDIGEATVTDQNDNAFSLVKRTFVQVVTPRNGDSWKEGSAQTITWAADNVETVKIEVSTDGGVSWSLVANNVSGAGKSYNWQVPQTESDTCIIRISDTANPDISDVSDGSFRIVTSDYITVIAPSGGDTWSVNTQKDITWEVKGVQTVTIDLSYDNGETWPVKIAENTNAITGSYRWTIPDQASEQCRIRLTDVARPERVVFVTDTFRILKPELTIAHTPQRTARENEEITFTASITSTTDLKTVTLYYNQMGQSEGLITAPMEKGEGDEYTYSLPTGVFIAPGIEYYIVATDVNDMSARSPIDVGVHAVNSIVMDVKSTQTIAGGSVQTAYRMVSIPLTLTSVSIVDQLRNTQPTGNMGTEWRIFRYPAGSSTANEYPDIEPFAPGKAFWVISTTNFTLKAPQGTTVSTEEAFQLTLKSGWNDIANPWMFDILWSNIENRSSANLSTPYTYEGKWSDPTKPPTKLEPWKGYAVRNLESSDRIIFLRTNSMVEKPAVPANTMVWKLSVSAAAGEALDTANHLGVRTDAAAEWDMYDHVEPPGVGDYVSVSFPHPDWSVYPYDYTVDFRPPSESLSWDFVVRTNIEREIVDVAFEGIGELPEGTTLVLTDRDLDERMDVDGAGFSFVSAEGITERHFTLTVSGSGEQEQDEMTPEPEEFITAAVFPNPFNPQTTLRYELSESAVVRITIYNSLGQSVRVYHPGHMEAGVHETVFDAAGLTSGLYIYRIDAGYSSITGKMLYMK